MDVARRLRLRVLSARAAAPPSLWLEENAVEVHFILLPRGWRRKFFAEHGELPESAHVAVAGLPLLATSDKLVGLLGNDNANASLLLLLSPFFSTKTTLTGGFNRLGGECINGLAVPERCGDTPRDDRGLSREGIIIVCWVKR